MCIRVTRSDDGNKQKSHNETDTIGSQINSTIHFMNDINNNNHKNIRGYSCH